MKETRETSKLLLLNKSLCCNLSVIHKNETKYKIHSTKEITE